MTVLAPAGGDNNSRSSSDPAGLCGPPTLDVLRMNNISADQSSPSAAAAVPEKLQAAAPNTANKQNSGSSNSSNADADHSSTAACSALESSIWALPAIMPQLSNMLDTNLDTALDTPFLHPIGGMARPHSFSFPAGDAPLGAYTPSPITNDGKGSSINSGLARADSTAALTHDSRSSFLGSNSVPVTAPQVGACRSAKRVSWLDSSLDTSRDPAVRAPGLQGCPSLEALQHELLVSTHSAPPPSGAGDLRDQGRLSSAGLACALGSGSLSALLGAGCGVLEETGTPLKAGTVSTDCINNLLGSFGASLFTDAMPSTPPGFSAAAAAATTVGPTAAAAGTNGHMAAAGSSAIKAAQAAKPTAVLPDFVEAWEGCMGLSDAAGFAPPSSAANAAADRASGLDSRRRTSSHSGSAFAGAAGSVSAAAAVAAGCPDSTLQQNHLSNGSSHAPGTTTTQFLGSYPNSLMAHTYSSPMPGVAAPAAANSGSTAGRAHSAAGLPYQHSYPQACSGLQHSASTGVGFTEGYFALGELAYGSSYNGTYGPGVASHGMQGCMQGPHSTALPLQATLSAPMGHSYSNQAFAAVMQAYCQAGMLAGVPPGMYEAWMLAYLNSMYAADSQGSPNTYSSSSDMASSWNSQAGQHFPPSGGRLGTGRNSLDAGVAGFAARGCQPPHMKVCRRYGNAANSKVDPKSLCGVDPRLCVGNPHDVEFEVCRRNPGLAELLRIPPRSIKLNNVAVHQDTSPPEQLSSKRADGPITPEELTIESGLLRHCFGLPSSIGPDLVRAARHAVTRGDKPGSGLEPFFWVLQAKLNWLLKRPVFFKGQLLRGEIHAITDQQRAQSFAQVTEQRSKLGELLLVMYRMLQQ